MEKAWYDDSGSLNLRQCADAAPEPVLNIEQSEPRVASTSLKMLIRSHSQQKPWLCVSLLPVNGSICHPHVGSDAELNASSLQPYLLV